MYSVVLLVCVGLALALASPFGFTPNEKSAALHGRSLSELQEYVPRYQKALRQAKQDLQSMKSQGEIHASVNEMVEAHKKKRTLSSACITDLTALSGIFASTDCLNADASEMYDFTKDYNETLAAVTTFCTSTCKTSLQDKLNDLSTSCAGDWADIGIYEDVFNQLNQWLEVPCLQDDNQNYCFPEFKEFFNRAITIIVLQPDDALPILEAACSDCTIKVFGALTAFASDEEAAGTYAFLDILCFKINNEFCFLKFLEHSQILSSSSATTTQKAEAMCSPCFQGYLRKLGVVDEMKNETDSSSATLEAALALYCIRRPSDNQFCIAAFEATGTGVDAACPNFGVGTCPGGCKSALGSAVSDLGCCTEVLFEFADFGCASDPTDCGITGAQMRAYIAGECGVTVPETCNQDQFIATLVFTNINPAYFANNEATVTQRTRAAIALIYGVQESRIGGFSASSSNKRDTSAGVEAKFTISGDNNAVANAQTNTDNVKTADLAPLNSLGVASRTDPTQPVGFEAKSTQTIKDSSAAAAQASLFLVLCGVILSLVM